MDIGVWMAPEVLQHKLEARLERNTLASWNVRSIPSGLGESGPDRLFVASRGEWVGFFELEQDVLWTPDDPAAPVALLFDTRSWTPVHPGPVRRFRGIRALRQPPTAMRTMINSGSGSTDPDEKSLRKRKAMAR
jgi:hypothetical protein